MSFMGVKCVVCGKSANAGSLKNPYCKRHWKKRKAWLRKKEAENHD